MSHRPLRIKTIVKALNDFDTVMVLLLPVMNYKVV